jgi:Holliday junction resolvase-like predicted endonuclease
LAVDLIAHQGKIVYAQEIRDPSHHVAIKLIVTDSEEHRILRFLQSQGTEVSRENCLIPVLEIFSNGPFSFVVMPRQVNIA